MSTKIGFNNFKAFGSQMQYFTKKPITLVYGPNSVGKSSLLHSLLFLESVKEFNAHSDKSNFAGDEISLGGFDNFVHKHEFSRTITFEKIITKKEDILKMFISDFEVVKSKFEELKSELEEKKEFEQKKSTEEINHIINTHKNIKDAYIKYYNLDENIDNKDIDVEKFQTIWHLLFLIVDQTKPKKIKDALDDLYYILTINEIRLKIDFRREAVEEPKLTFFIDNEVLFEENFNDNELFDRIKNFSSFFNGKFVLLIKNAAEDNDLALLLHLFFLEDKSPQYYGPMRFYPKREDMLEITKEDETKVKKSTTELNEDEMKTIQKLIKISPILTFFHFKWLKILWERGIFNFVLSNKNKKTKNGAFTSERTWIELIHSVDLQDKLNKWLSDEKKLKSTYRISTKKSMTNFIATFKYKWKYFKFHEKFDSSKKTALNKFFELFENFLEFLLKKFLKLKDRYLTELIFTDMRTGTEVTPRDMGLGISQMLPILISTMGSQSTRIYLEQPELHLHPAVQMELMDEFIRSHNENNNEFMMESHSEHMLLRVMKRLRQTADGTLEDESLRLTPDDVCLLYVDNDGKQTYIQELRLSEKGRLKDRWPNGFFEEGFKERFS